MPINYQQKKNTNTVFGGSDGIIVPVGSTSGADGRPGSPGVGELRYNTTLGLAEFYTSNGWTAVAAPPSITTITGIINADQSTTITVNGTNFVNGAVVSIKGAATSNVSRLLTTTFVNSGQLTAVTNSNNVNFVGNAAFDVIVTNPSGLSATLASAGVIDRSPLWSTSAGTLATINDALGSYSPIATLSASDPDASAIVYALSSGTLPAGTSLNTTNGQISGTPSLVGSSTTSTFTITATSNTVSIPRTFSIVVNPTADGSTSARAATSATNLYNLGIRGKGAYYINTPNGGVVQTWCDMDTTAEDGTSGWMLVASFIVDWQWTFQRTSTRSYLNGTSAADNWSANFGDFSTKYFRITANPNVNSTLGSSAVGDWYFYYGSSNPSGVAWKTLWAAGSGTNNHWTTENQGVSPINSAGNDHPRVSMRLMDWSYHLQARYRASQRYNSLSDAGSATGQVWPDYYSGLTTPSVTLGVYNYANAGTGNGLDGTLAMAPSDGNRANASQNTYAHDCDGNNSKVGKDDDNTIAVYRNNSSINIGQSPDTTNTTSLWFWVKN